MARTFAQVQVAIWADTEFRQLPRDSQWLYFHLMTSPALTLAGVTDWRPKRIAPKAADTTSNDVEEGAGPLIEGRYIIVDEETEEVLIRSFIRNDGILKQPKMGVAVFKAYGEIASESLRQAVVQEVRRLHSEVPDMPGMAALQSLIK